MAPRSDSLKFRSLSTSADAPIDVLCHTDAHRPAAIAVIDEHVMYGQVRPSAHPSVTPIGLLTDVLFCSVQGRPHLRVALGPDDRAALDAQLDEARAELEVLADDELSFATRRARTVMDRIADGLLTFVDADPDDPRLQVAEQALYEVAHPGAAVVRIVRDHPDRDVLADQRMTGDAIRALAAEHQLPVVYVDGSVVNDDGRRSTNSAAWAWWSSPDRHGSGPLSTPSGTDIPALVGSSFGRAGTWAELQAVLEAVAAFDGQPIAIVTDCFEVVAAMRGGLVDHPLAAAVRDAVLEAGAIVFPIKGHSDPAGHNHADQLARRTARAAQLPS